LNSAAGKELTIRDLTVIYRRRQLVIYAAVAAMAALAAVYCLISTRRYEATGTIQVQSKSQDRLGLDSITGSTADNDGDTLAATMDIQTQANILQSDTLALKTIEDLHLLDTKDFQPHFSAIGWVLGLLSKPGTPDPAAASLEDSPKKRRQALAVFSSNLKVKPVPGTRLIQITYVDRDPKLAAAVVNKLTQSLIGYTFQTRFEATNEAADWLSGQLGELRQQSEQLQRQVADLESKSGVYSLGTVDSHGRDQAYSGVLDQLQQATAVLSQAEQNRILRGAILHAAQNGDAEMLSGLAGNAGNGAVVNNSLGLIQTLRSQEGSQQATLQQAESKYGAANPKLQEIRSNLAGIHHSIQQEIERLKARAQSDYDDATRAEAETRDAYDRVKAQADTLNNKSVDFAILRQEADESRKLYQELLERFKEAGVLESLKGSMITVVDPGRVPGEPKTPNVRMAMIGGVVAGLFAGCCLALVLEALDTRVRTIAEVERISGGNLFGATPLFLNQPAPSSLDGPPRLASLDEPRSRYAEAARAIRTEIFLRSGGEASNVILVTSSIAGEGKTTLCANLAVLLAQAGKRVLAVDADLRAGGLQAALNLAPSPGLCELLDGLVQFPRIYAVTEVPHLDALQAGAATSYPSELLGSSLFVRWLSTWRDQYDYILLDSAPLLAVTDSLSLAPLSDIVLLVARPGLTEKSQLTRSYQMLSRGGKHFVAAVVNGLPAAAEDYSVYFAAGKATPKAKELVGSKS
jgi:succinoglycan biosynthesis transport protein ExoP